MLKAQAQGSHQTVREMQVGLMEHGCIHLRGTEIARHAEIIEGHLMRSGQYALHHGVEHVGHALAKAYRGIDMEPLVTAEDTRGVLPATGVL